MLVDIITIIGRNSCEKPPFDPVAPARAYVYLLSPPFCLRHGRGGNWLLRLEVQAARLAVTDCVTDKAPGLAEMARDEPCQFERLSADHISRGCNQGWTISL